MVTRIVSVPSNAAPLIFCRTHFVSEASEFWSPNLDCEVRAEETLALRRYGLLSPTWGRARALAGARGVAVGTRMIRYVKKYAASPSDIREGDDDEMAKLVLTQPRVTATCATFGSRIC